mmetsp:Transcript_83198/g.240362  ORF Transcript_83198/g.240362 Transcript_83198/m.240362 type:complete len:222 (-) Transcript_83198:12-677(-)
MSEKYVCKSSSKSQLGPASSFRTSCNWRSSLVIDRSSGSPSCEPKGKPFAASGATVQEPSAGGSGAPNGEEPNLPKPKGDFCSKGKGAAVHEVPASWPELELEFQNGQRGLFKFTRNMRKKVVFARSNKIGCNCFTFAALTVSASQVRAKSPRSLLAALSFKKLVVPAHASSVQKPRRATRPVAKQRAGGAMVAAKYRPMTPPGGPNAQRGRGPMCTNSVD